jgi:hypothetical protein
MYFFTVSAFSPQSKEYVFVKKWGSEGTGDGQFIDPEHLAIDSEGFVYVSE